MNKICVSVSGKNLVECIAALGNATFAELRLDLIVLNADEISQLMTRCPQWIITVRESFLSKPDCLVLFSETLKHQPLFVDIDFLLYENNVVKTCLDLLGKTQSKLMFSYHNFECTPPTEFLEKTTKQMFLHGAVMVKIACMVNEYEDNLLLMSLYDKFPDIISFGMGSRGKISRLAALFFGDGISYAAPDHGQSTAEGQLTYSEMLSIFQSLQ